MFAHPAQLSLLDPMSLQKQKPSSSRLVLEQILEGCQQLALHLVCAIRGCLHSNLSLYVGKHVKQSATCIAPSIGPFHVWFVCLRDHSEQPCNMLYSMTNNVMQLNLRTVCYKCCMLMLLLMYVSHASESTTVCRLTMALTCISQLQMNSWIWLPLSRQT